MRDSIFLTSRRRHTRWPRDWSSDVCSSDLTSDPGGSETDPGPGAESDPPGSDVAPDAALTARSEERRVGKECRKRSWQGEENKRNKREEYAKQNNGEGG